jgi:diaminopimelate epimerase
MTFYKYQGTGNDFILIDNRNSQYQPSQEQIAGLCHRHLGIGADGLMLLELADGYDFRMVYYNSDGRESTMCGNGGRCITAFARHLKIIERSAHFIAIDGPHTAAIHPDGQISLQMQDVGTVDIREGYTILNTGSPHYVAWVRDVNAIDVFSEGKAIRNSPEFKLEGINVNFTQIVGDSISVRTYERGVEDETMSCGTGVTAAAIAATCHSTGTFNTHVATPGGKLQLSFTKNTPTSATDVLLTGPAVFVFQGVINAG